MLFNIEADTGAEIVGYLVPDSFTDTAELALIAGGQVLWAGPTDEPRPALVASGRHGSGICGFRLGPPKLPGLTGREDLEIRDIASGLTVYRRGAGRDTVEARLFRLETRLVPALAFDQAMEPFFRAWYPAIERHGAETVNQIFLLAGTPSLYASGRLHLPAVAQLGDGSVTVAMQLRDPFEELAERLLVLSGARGAVERRVGLRDRLAFIGAIEALDGLPLASARQVRRALRALPAEAAAQLSNPLARQLTTAQPSDLCGPGAVAAGLRALAGMEIVSVGALPGYFEAAVGAFIARPPALAARDPWAGETAALAETLSAIAAAEALIECDLEIYASVSGAFEALATGTDQR